MKTTLLMFLTIVGTFTLFTSNAQRAKDGDYTVTSLNEVVNTYTYLTSTVGSGSTSISVANNSMTGGVFSGALAQGDVVLIIQMYGASVDVNTWPTVAGWGPYTWPQSYFDIGAGINPETFGSISSYGWAGRFERREVLSVTGTGTITFTCGLERNYNADKMVQIVRIPRFDNLTLNAATSIIPSMWNGQTGGIVALEVDGVLDINASATITASGAGFRGGALDATGKIGSSGTADQERFLGSSSAAEGSERGESIFGWYTEYENIYSRFGIGAIANGGGGGGYQNCGGGGGSNVQVGAGAYNGHGNPWGPGAYNAAWALDPEVTSSSGGGCGGYALSQNPAGPTTVGPNNVLWGGDTRKDNGGRGGHPLTYDASRLFFGGGGGAGDQDSDQGGAGGRGGGIIFITNYGSMTGSGTIEANGADGQKTNPSNQGLGLNPHKGNDGAGGGGAGGSIYIENATAIPASLTFNAIGGNGGDHDLQVNIGQTPEAAGPGGSGSGGAIAFTNGAPIQNVSPGAGGTSNSSHMAAFPPNGATEGSSGASSLSATFFDFIPNGATICAGNTADISITTVGTVPSGWIAWYDAPYEGNLMGVNATLTTPVLNSTTTYYVGICPGTFRVPVTVTVNTGANLIVTDPNPICGSGTVDITQGAVTVGSDPGTLTYWTDMAATNTLATPSSVGNGTYYIMLDIGGGCTDVQAVNVAVNPNPTLNISDPSATCDPGTIDLTTGAVTSGSDPGTLTYWTDMGATNTLGSPGAVLDGTYYIQLEDANNCTTVMPVNATVNPTPNLVITDPTAACAPGTVDITAGSVTAGSDAGTLSYWTDNGATSTLGNPTTVGTGTYYIQLEDANNCTSVQPVNAIVTASPNLVITDPSACAPGTVDLTAGAVTAGSDPGALSYWTDLGASNSLATPTSVGNGTYYIQLDIGGGCTTVEMVTATINAIPNLVVTDPASICEPGTVDLTPASVTAGSDAGTITYWTDNGATSTLGSPTSVGTGTYYIQLEDANNCTNVQAVNATVNTLPTLTITNPSAVCAPSTVDITLGGVTAGSDVGSLTYWTDAAATSTLGAPTAVGNGSYFIQLEDANNCSVVEQVDVVVNAQPNLSITDPNAICAPATVDITQAGVTAGSDLGALVYWTDMAGTNTLSNPSMVGTGVYYIQLVDANLCSSIQAVNVTVNPQPILVITDPNAACVPGTVDVTNPSVTTGSDAGTLSYWTDMGATSTLASPSTIASTGIYYIQLEDANNCTSIEAVNVTVTSTPNLVVTDPAGVCDPLLVDITDPLITAGSDVGTLTYWIDAGASTPVSTPNAVGAGVYYIQLDLGGGCTSIEQVNTTVFATPNLVVTAPSAVCFPNTVDITAPNVTAGSDPGTLNYWLDSGATNGLSNPNSVGSGVYFIQLEDANNCTSVESVPVTVNMPEDATFILVPTCDGSIAQVTGVVDGVFSFATPPSDNAVIDPISGTITGGEFNTVYEVQYTTSGFCSDSSVVAVVSDDCTNLDVVIPSAITPDNDMVNDSWEIPGLDNNYPNNSVIVYNRWGNVVFEHVSTLAEPYSANQWDGTHNGKLLPVASYYYIINANDGSDTSYKGTVTIIIE